MSRVLLLVPRLPAVSTRIAIPPQLPLGHVLLASRLYRAGYDELALIDAEHERLSDAELDHRVRALKPDVVLLGHSASTIAHTQAVESMRIIKRISPSIRTIYGGLYPTQNRGAVVAALAGLADAVVVNEAEQSILEAIDAVQALGPDTAAAAPEDQELPRVIHGQQVSDLDANRPLWGLFEQSLSRYTIFGRRSAVVQFSRGCPKRCSYCGQWKFWRRERHRSVASFIEEVAELRGRGVRVFVIADENWSIDRELFLSVLEGLRTLNMRNGSTHHIVVTMEPGHIIRDRDAHKLYREAGLAQLMLGVDGEDEEGALGATQKPFDDAELRNAIESLRNEGVTTIINHFVSHKPRLRAQQARRAQRLNSDFYNCLYATPHTGTALERRSSSKDDTAVYRPLEEQDYRWPVQGTGAKDLLRQNWQGKRIEWRLNVPVLWRFLLMRRRQRHLFDSIIRSAHVFLLETARLARQTLRRRPSER